MEVMKRPTSKNKNESGTIARIREHVLNDGGRMGKARIEIIALLEKQKQPCSIKELAKKAHADEVSVYRTIHFLISHKLVEEIIRTDGVRTYTLSTDHHDHVVCTGCGFVAHVPCREIIQKISVATFKKIESHTLTYYGICSVCAA